MNKPILIDLFAEDRATRNGFVRSLRGSPRRRAAGSASGSVPQEAVADRLKELELYQRGLDKKLGGGFPDLLVVAIDGNCTSFSEARKAVANALRSPLSSCAVQATPDPHVNAGSSRTWRRFIAWSESHRNSKPGSASATDSKRDPAGAIAEAGHPATFGGIEFARELVAELDYYRAGKADQSLKHFLEELRARLRQIP